MFPLALVLFVTIASCIYVFSNYSSADIPQKLVTTMTAIGVCSCFLTIYMDFVMGRMKSPETFRDSLTSLFLWNILHGFFTLALLFLAIFIDNKLVFWISIFNFIRTVCKAAFDLANHKSR